MDFVNQTGSKNYAYLSNSLSADVKKNIKKKFNYQKTSHEKNEQVLEKILKSNRKKKTPVHASVKLNIADIRELSEEQNLDVVIYGSFDIQQRRRRSWLWLWFNLNYTYVFLINWSF